MGLLLGYPVEDVKGFIVHDGKNFLYSGYWKVYTDVSEKMRLFRKFETARENLVQWVSDGFGIQEAIRRGSQVEFGARTA